MKAVLLFAGAGIAWLGYIGGSDLTLWAGIVLIGLSVALAVNWADGPPWFSGFWSDSGDGSGGEGGGGD